MPLVRPADTIPVPAPPRRPPDRRPLLAGLRGDSTWAAVIAWLSLLYGSIALALVVLGWALGDRTWWLFVANLTVIYWLAPSLVAAAVAVARRWWLVALVCALGATVWLATFGPLFVGRGSAEAPARVSRDAKFVGRGSAEAPARVSRDAKFVGRGSAEAPRDATFVPQGTPAGDGLRVATFNMSPRPDVDHVVRLVERTDPDVLLLQEVLPEAQDDLIRSLRTLPYHRFAPVNTAAPGGGGTAVLSRLPIVATRPIAGLPPSSRPADLVSLDTGRGTVTVVSLHLTSPCAACVTGLDHPALRGSLEEEAKVRRLEVQRVAAALPAGPVVVGGDLNSSTHNVPRRRLLSAGLVDLHRAVGSGPGFTRFRWHGLVRIDWLLASRDLTPIREWVERRDGSDHRPVVADVALPPPA